VDDDEMMMMMMMFSRCESLRVRERENKIARDKNFQRSTFQLHVHGRLAFAQYNICVYTLLFTGLSCFSAPVFRCYITLLSRARDTSDWYTLRALYIITYIYIYKHFCCYYYIYVSRSVHMYVCVCVYLI
jgi:hypothetical protein